MASSVSPSENGDHLIVSYDRRNDLMTLYSTGVTPSPPASVPFHADWSATGGM